MPEIVGTLKPPRHSAPPSSPVGGQIYYDTDDNQLYYWNGTTWITGLTGPPGPAGTVYDSDQVGTIKAYTGATIPTNWMLADGRSLATASYPDLFAAIGYTYGGSGANFNLPDLRGKIIYGISVTGDLGASGGASVVTLDLTQIPSHNHGGVSTGADRSLATTSGAADRALIANTGGSHSHGTATSFAYFARGQQDTAQLGSGGTSRYIIVGWDSTTDTHAGHTHTVTDHLHSVPGVDHLHGISSAGGGLSHENMPPYVRVAHIIKVIGVTINPGGALVGATGAKGDPGPWRGVWSAAASYAVGDSVSYFDGLTTGSYRRKVAGTTAGTPKADTTNWEVIASGGSIGVDGAVAVYEQAGTPASTAVGAIWIDTDDVAPTWTIGIPFVSVLPTNPVDGQEIYYQNTAMAAEGIIWHLRYRASSASAYKWEFIGGSPLYNLQPANENINNVGYVALATAGPSIPLPLAGDYDIEHGFFMNNAVNGVSGQMSYDIGATGAVDGDSCSAYCNTFGADTAYSIRNRRKTGLTAVTLTAKYKCNGSFWFADRWLRARPVRVG